MNIPEYEEGLVTQYVKKIAAEGVKAFDGADVKSAVDKIVDDAAQHFAVVKSSTELGNLKRFSGMLSLFAFDTHESQPQYRATFEHAKARADDIIKRRTA